MLALQKRVGGKRNRRRWSPLNFAEVLPSVPPIANNRKKDKAAFLSKGIIRRRKQYVEGHIEVRFSFLFFCFILCCFFAAIFFGEKRYLVSDVSFLQPTTTFPLLLPLLY